MSEVMIDLETLGTENDAVIISIGAVEFVAVPEFRVLGKFYCTLETKSQELRGRKAYADTCFWWMKQSQEARDAFFVNQKDNWWMVEDALSRLEEFCNRAKGVWGNGAMFDNALVKSLAKSFSIRDPWDYRKNRCYRTIKNLHPSIAVPGRQGVSHNALDDAEWQAEHLSTIFQETMHE